MSIHFLYIFKTTMSLKLYLTCSYCSKILDRPITLPCADTICQEHLHENPTKTHLKCLTCDADLNLKTLNPSDLKPNKAMQKLLDSEIYLSEEEKSLKYSLDEFIVILHHLSDEYQQTKLKLNLECHEHFQEIRRLIDIHREQIKIKIDDLALAMIDQTKVFESSFEKSLRIKFENETEETPNNKLNLDEERKDLEAKFRDPNLLIESIRYLKLKQETTIDDLKIKLKEMTQIKDHLKANEFKANLSVDIDATFGSLNLIEYFDNPFKSKLLSKQQSLDLIKVCEFTLDDKWTLLYRGSLHGFGGRDFHAKCDGKSNTLTVLKAATSSYVFGAYTSATWDTSGRWKRDPNAFIFSLINKNNKPLKIRVDASNVKCSIHCYTDEVGPAFGSGHDIYIADNANANTDSYSELGHSYKHTQFPYGTIETKSFLAGSYKFKLSEIEVYQKE